MSDDNNVAKVVKGIGVGIIIVGIIASLILGNDSDSVSITVGGIIGSIIGGVLFIGLSEIIDLLQLSYDKNCEIYRELKNLNKSILDANKSDEK